MDQSSPDLPIKNPDVVLREEDADGALLFNPDTNQIKVINTTGLFVWEKCDGKHNLDEIIASMDEAFEDVPVDRVKQEVQTFVDELLQTGFIGLTR